ncbi:MAG: MMPL family transporter [Lentisphaerales bacterium]|nr:MMPL family transporter [Lentisphaerales bacterium]
MKLNSSIQQVMENDQRAKASYQKFNEAFDSKNAVVLIAKIPNLFSNKGSQTLYDISESLASLPHLKDIKSLTHSGRPVRHGFSLDIRKMIKIEPFIDTLPKTTEEWQKLAAFATSYPMTKNILVSADAKYAMIMAVLSESLNTLKEKQQTKQLTIQGLQRFSDQGIEFNFLSEPFVTTEFYQMTTDFLIRYTILSIVISSLIIFLVFKSLSILLLMTCNQICGLLIFPLIFYFNYADINVYTFIVIPLISAIQLTFLTHFYSVFKRHISTDQSLSASFHKSLSTTLFPSTLAMLSTGIGLATLHFSEIAVIKTVGTIGIQALLAVFALTFLPPYLISRTCSNKSVHEPTDQLNSSSNPRFLKIAQLVSYFLLALSAISIALIKDIEIDVRTKEFLHPKSTTRQSIELIDNEIGGVNVFELVVKTPAPGQVQSYKALKFCHDFRQKILTFPAINSAYSYSQLYTVIHQLFLADNYSIGDVFPPPLQASFYSKIINSQKFPFQNILQNEDLSETTLFIRTKDLPSADFLAIINKVLETANSMAPDGVQVIVKNGLHSLLASDRKIVKSQIYSLAGSLISIFVLFIIIWRSLKLAFIATLVNTVPLALLFGVMAMCKVSLNSINVMVAPIILGICVDDSIHFICYFKKQLDTKKNFYESLSITLKQKSKPIICTSLILSASLSLLYLAPFPPVQTFGILGTTSLTFALLCTLILLPVLLRMHKNALFKRED